MAVREDIDAVCTVTRAIGPVSIASSTTTVSSAIDCTAYKHGTVLLVVHSVGTFTDGSYIASITDCDTSGGSYTSASTFSGSLSAITAANGTKTAAFVLTAGRPFVKVTITSSGVTSGALNSAHVIAVPPALI